MKINQPFVFLLTLLVFLGCKNNTKRDVSNNAEPLATEINHSKKDALLFGVGALLDTSNLLLAVKSNFKRINNMNGWDSVVVRDINMSAEGGKAKYYMANNKLEKIDARFYGETSKRFHEYYLKDSALSFVYEKINKYNRPYTWDSTAMKENNDTQVFDIKRSEIIEIRSYFNGEGKLFHQISSPTKSGNLENGLGEYGTRLISEYKVLLDSLREN